MAALNQMADEYGVECMVENTDVLVEAGEEREGSGPLMNIPVNL